MMLAKKYDGRDPRGWWISEKYDGVRAFWDGANLRTKDSWLVIDAPDFITSALPRGKSLDGELWAGRGTFETMRVLAQYKRSGDLLWSKVQYMVFDAPTTDAVKFEDRQKALSKMPYRSHISIVGHELCTGAAHMAREFRRVIASGGEGLVLRAPGHCYEFGRSWAWQKVKPAGID